MFELLWDYQNWDLTSVLMEFMHYMDLMCQVRGEPTAWDKFVEDNSIPTYTMHENNGKKILINNQTGQAWQVKKPTPRYLKVIK